MEFSSDLGGWAFRTPPHWGGIW